MHPDVINSSFMERAEFRGADNCEIQSRRQRMNSALESGIVSKQKDIAEAIWDAVRNNKSEIVVGPAVFATEYYQLLPGLVHFLMAKV